MSTKTRLFAKDVMFKRKLIASEEMPVAELVKLLRRLRIGGVPVMDENKKICGIVTVTDVFNAMKMVRRMHRGHEDWLALFLAGKNTIHVRDIYTPKVIFVLPWTPLEKVVDIMLTKNVHTVPVLNETKTEVYGVVGRHDITWAIFAPKVGAHWRNDFSARR